jgi:hypothetical protein
VDSSVRLSLFSVLIGWDGAVVTSDCVLAVVGVAAVGWQAVRVRIMIRRMKAAVRRKFESCCMKSYSVIGSLM